MVTKVYLVRDILSTGYNKNIFVGSLDLEVSELGERQLEAVRNYFKDFPVEVIYSSPLIRAKKTAKAIAEETNIKSIKNDDRLKEINAGKLEGLPFDEISKIYPQVKLLWETMPQKFEAVGGEKMTDVYNRITKAVLDIAAENEGKKVAIVSHGTAIRNFLSYALGRSIDFISVTPMIGHGTVAELEIENGEVVSVNMLNIQSFN